MNVAISHLGGNNFLSTWGGARSAYEMGRGSAAVGPGVAFTVVGIGSVHKSVLRSLKPRKITLPLYSTSHFASSNVTMHPALHRGLIPMSDATMSEGTMCPFKMVGSPVI